MAMIMDSSVDSSHSSKDFAGDEVIVSIIDDISVLYSPSPKNCPSSTSPKNCPPSTSISPVENLVELEALLESSKNNHSEISGSEPCPESGLSNLRGKEKVDDPSTYLEDDERLEKSSGKSSTEVPRQERDVPKQDTTGTTTTKDDQFIQTGSSWQSNMRANVGGQGPPRFNGRGVHRPPFDSLQGPRFGPYMYPRPPPMMGAYGNMMHYPDLMEEVAFGYHRGMPFRHPHHGGMPFRPPHHGGMPFRPPHHGGMSFQYRHPLSGPYDPLPPKIVKQIDYYFSEENMAKDLFLRSNMDREGWVPISLIANFPRVKRMTRSIPFILKSLRASNVIEIQGNRIRRRHNWMKWILSTPNVQDNLDKTEVMQASSSNTINSPSEHKASASDESAN